MSFFQSDAERVKNICVSRSAPRLLCCYSRRIVKPLAASAAAEAAGGRAARPIELYAGMMRYVGECRSKTLGSDVTVLIGDAYTPPNPPLQSCAGGPRAIID